MQLIASPAFFLRAVTERAVHELEQEQGTVQMPIQRLYIAKGVQNYEVHLLLLFIFRVTFRGQ